jgi:hypothetical protein
MMERQAEVKTQDLLEAMEEDHMAMLHLHLREEHRLVGEWGCHPDLVHEELDLKKMSLNNIADRHPYMHSTNAV